MQAYYCGSGRLYRWGRSSLAATFHLRVYGATAAAAGLAAWLDARMVVQSSAQSEAIRLP